MYRTKFFSLLILLAGIYSIGYSQIGTWRSHLPFSSASSLVKAGDKVYCATNGGLFYYKTTDKSIEKFGKENGLSDTDVSALGYSNELGVLIIGYSNANVDFISNNIIYNIPDIMRYGQILGDKRIYSILVRDNYAYLTTGFGIVVLDLQSREVSETYKIGEGGTPIKVNELCYNEGFFYAATDQGIYTANANAPNLQDYSYWSRVTEIPEYNKTFNSITVAGGRVYASYQSGSYDGDKIYCKDGNNWFNFTNTMIKSPGEVNDNSKHLSNWNGNLVFSGRYHVDVFNKDGERIKHFFTGSPQFSFREESGILWVADDLRGLIQNPDEGTLNVLNPNGPSSIFSSHIAISDDILYSVPGGLSSSFYSEWRKGEVNTFKNNEWSSKRSEEFYDYYRIAIDPLDPEHYFIASWGWGLFEFKGDSLIRNYNDTNSSLRSIIPGPYYRLGGLGFDSEGNLWITNGGLPEPLSVLKKDGEWKSFDLDNLAGITYIGDIIETKSGYKWMIMANYSRGLLVIDDNGTIDNTDDDRYIKFDVKDLNNAIITNEIYSMAEDHDGNIWLGTNKGILVYYNPDGVFEGSNFYAQQIIIPRNDGTPIGDALLGTESVTSIAIDGANRKWLGTLKAGVSLVSDDGLTQIHNFTAENSPLLSNSISSIAINGKTGEVFFGTNNGIISYRSDATGPAESFSSVYVYPNPVRESYEGDIAIAGLMENTKLKITDLNGNLVFETVSSGGQAIWNGKNFRGERVSTGVYLVFCSSEDGLLSHVTKLLFIH